MLVLIAFLAGLLCAYRMGSFALIVLNAATAALALGWAASGGQIAAIAAVIVALHLGTATGLWRRALKAPSEAQPS